MNFDDALRSIFGMLPESLRTFSKRTPIYRIASGNMVTRAKKSHQRNRTEFVGQYAKFMRENPSFLVGEVTNHVAESEMLSATSQYKSASEIIQVRQSAEKRSVGVEGFLGIALDDAMFDIDKQRHILWSNASITHYISGLAYSLSDQPSILEFGCGAAHQFYFFREFGIRDYVGLDGNPYFIKLNPHLAGYSDHFKLVDLNTPVRLGLSGRDLEFDLVTSFEVLEHIQESSVPTLIESMKNHLKPGGVLLCTASLVDGLDVHITVKPREWWSEKFDIAGFEPHERAQEIIDALSERHPSNWNGTSTNVFALVHKSGDTLQQNESEIE